MKKILALLLFVGATSIYAQQKTHTVQAKETVYGISKQYGISQSELYKANPKIEQNGIHPGDLLVIPGKVDTITEEIMKDASKVSDTFTDDNFIYVTIQPKETLYNLSKKYIYIAEYFNPIPIMVQYRGRKNKLFKRDGAISYIAIALTSSKPRLSVIIGTVV
jgi:LysM repeat protein